MCEGKLRLVRGVFEGLEIPSQVLVFQALGWSEAPRRKAPGLPKGKALGGCRPQIPRFAIHPHRKRWGSLAFPHRKDFQLV